MSDLEKHWLLVYENPLRGSMQRALKVKTSFDVVEKWYGFKPKLFKITLIEFKKNIQNLQSDVINLNQ